jgi:ABC-type multidrug transport system fused ATPase/permease subunit
VPLITLDTVSYHYPDADRPALSNVTAAIEPGEVILLRGPSGSGK